MFHKLHKKLYSVMNYLGNEWCSRCTVYFTQQQYKVHFFKERQHTSVPITDTISSKLPHYDNFNALCGTNIKLWKILGFNFFLRKKLQDKLSNDCVTLPGLFKTLQRGTNSNIWCLIVH